MNGGRVAVLASGSGTNLQALHHHLHGTRHSASIAAAVSDRGSAAALDRARAMGVPTHTLADHRSAAELLGVLRSAGATLIALAGYTRLIPAAVVEEYRGRIVNVHPSLLPAFGGVGMYGTRVHQAVLQSGSTVTGVTVHLVDEEYDRGRVLAQWPVPVLPGDTVESLAARVLRVEHILYPRVVERLLYGHESSASDVDDAEFQLHLGRSDLLEAQVNLHLDRIMRPSTMG